MTPEPFVVFSLPRSRSSWLSHWLSFGGHRIGHDLGIEVDSPQEFIKSFCCGLSGTIETGGAIEGWRLLRRAMPRVRFVTVRRPLAEVFTSLAKFGLVPVPGELEVREALLDEIETLGGAERLRYCDLDSINCRKWLWHYCLGPSVPFTPAWDASCVVTNIQVDMPRRLQRLKERQPAIEVCQRELRRQLGELGPCRTLQ